jgi:hypothetical protein
MPDGREICSKTPVGRREYNRRIVVMWKRDGCRCCLCGQPINLCDATFEHKESRGMNGSKRDDRIEFNGVSHWNGNMAKGSMHIDNYLEKPLFERIQLCLGRAISEAEKKSLSQSGSPDQMQSLSIHQTSEDGDECEFQPDMSS